MKRNFKLLVATLVLVVMVFTLASCAQVQGIIDKFMPHEHEYSAEWSSDETNHWHAAICEKGEECLSATADLAAHEIVDGACSVCGYKATVEDEEKPAPECKQHAWSGGYTVVKEPTCTEKGSNEHTCLICGEKGELEVAELGHSTEKLPGVAPSCDEPGISSGSYCTVCKEVLVEQTMIPATGHNYVKGVCSTCGAEDPNYDPHVTYIFETNTVVINKEDGSQNLTDKLAIPEGTTFVDGYFTIVGEVTQRVKNGEYVYCVEVGKQLKGGIQFTITGTATVEILFHSTSGSNTSWIGLIDADGNLIANNEGVNSVTGTGEGLLVTYTLSAGTYTVVSPALTIDETNEETGEVTTKDPYNRTARVYSIKVVELPPEEFVVETTDTYGYFDEYSFTAEAEGYYTFTLPAGLGFYSQAKYDSYAAPELDFYDNANGGTVVLGLKAGETIVFYVGAITRDTWTMTWTFAAGEVEDNTQGGGSSDVSDLYVGSNTVTLTGDDISNGKTFNFIVTEEGTYTFACDFFAIVCDETGMQIGRGQVYLVPGNYTVTLVSIMVMPAGNYTVRVEYTAPASGEPDGSSDYPFVLDTLPESVTFESDTFTYVYYVFTADADCSVTFTWATADSYFIYFELDENGNTTENSASGYLKLSHTILVEAGKSYKVGLCTWNEAGETTVTISTSTCDHVWSDATCSAPSTCSICGVTTGDTLEHTSSGEATCTQPEVCTVCGEELSTAWHNMDETYVYATCTEDGSYHGVCLDCGYEESNVIPAQGHSNWNMTCGDTGECMECGAEFTMVHDFTWSPATCTDPAYCGNCWQYIGEPLAHNYVNGVCTECYMEDPDYVPCNHEYFYPCDKVCMLCYEITNPDATHTIVAVDAKDATCTENGNIAYWYCSECGYAWADEALTQVTNRMSIIIPAAHTYAYSCDKVCAVCYELTNEDAEHTIVAVDAKAATCTATGNIAYWYCSECGYAWADEALTQVTNQMSIVVPTIDHDYDHVVTAPTCTAAGYTTHTCAFCDYSYTDSETEATGHADNNGDFKCDGCATTMLPEDGEALTIVEALAIAKLVGTSYTSQKYYVTGIIKSVYNTTYGNLYLVDDEGNELTIYGLYSADGNTRYDAMSYKPLAGDEITVYTVLGTYVNSNSGSISYQGKNAWLDEVVHEHKYSDATCTLPATCVCGETQGDALGHSYEEGSCTVCGSLDPDYEGEISAPTYVKVTSADDLTTGTYVLVVNGYVATKYDSASSGWVLTEAFTATGDTIVSDSIATWTLTVTGSNVTIKDSNGTFIKPKSGNNNGIQSGSYNWAWTISNGNVNFKGTGSDTTILAFNKQEGKIRAYKTTTVSGNATSYPSNFTLYKLVTD